MTIMICVTRKKPFEVGILFLSIVKMPSLLMGRNAELILELNPEQVLESFGKPLILIENINLRSKLINC